MSKYNQPLFLVSTIKYNQPLSIILTAVPLPFPHGLRIVTGIAPGLQLCVVTPPSATPGGASAVRGAIGGNHGMCCLGTGRGPSPGAAACGCAGGHTAVPVDEIWWNMMKFHKFQSALTSFTPLCFEKSQSFGQGGDVLSACGPSAATWSPGEHADDGRCGPVSISWSLVSTYQHHREPSLTIANHY